jgi:hypothetical protein
MTARALRQARAVRAPPGELRKQEGGHVPLDGRRPRLLDDTACALKVVCGHADLFAVSIADGAAAGARCHLCRIETGGVILGLPFVSADGQAQSIGVLAVGGQGTEALILDRALIEDGAAIETWVAKLASAMVETAAGWNARAAECGTSIELEAGQQLRAPAHGVAWVAVERGNIALMGGASICRAGDPPLPFASATWGEARGATRVRVLDSNAVLGPDPWPAIDRFHALAMRLIAERIAAANDAELTRIRQRARRATSHGGQMVGELAAVMMPRRDTGLRAEGADPLLDACRIAAEAIGVGVARIGGSAMSDRSSRGAAMRASRSRSFRSRPAVT